MGIDGWKWVDGLKFKDENGWMGMDGWKWMNENGWIEIE